MKKSKILAVALIGLLLAGALVLVGCDNNGDDGDDGYTFEFKVKNSINISMTTITKIEIFNGSSQSAPILLTETMNLAFNEMSGVYKVSGFTEKSGGDRRLFGVKITLGNGVTQWDYSARENKKKILINSFMSSSGGVALWDSF